MKSIILFKLILRNFMGIKDFIFDTGGTNTSVYANNGVGKTTLFTAFNWLLFDKDSADKSKFDVQPLDKHNNVIHHLDTEVEGILQVDGKKITLRKVLKEKWQKPKGQTEAELRGTETTYYVDDVPMKQSEYKDYIANITGGESVFKLITNPMYFSTALSWQERRKVLIDIIGGIDDAQVINYKPGLKPLQALLEDKDIETLKKSIAARKRKLNDDIKGIPPRIDELTRSIRADLDFEELENERQAIVVELQDIEYELADSSKADESVLADKKKLFELQGKLIEVEQKAKAEAQKPLQNLQQDYQQAYMAANDKQMDLKFAQNIVRESQKEIERLSKLNDDLREQWKVENAKTFEINEDEFICPTCKRPFDADDIEAKKQELLKNFNLNKAERLKAINEAGKANKKKIEELQQKIADANVPALEREAKTLEDKAAELKQKIDNFKPDTDCNNNPEYKAIKNAIADLEEKLQLPADTSTEREMERLKNRRAELEKELEEVTGKLAYMDTNESAKKRIAELEQQEKELNQQLADTEKIEALCEQFTRVKCELLEGTINSKFKYVKFRLFKQQVNGGIDDDCEPLVNGVPFSTSLNSGARINAGLDIINTLCEYYQINAPVWLDNRETVTKPIPIKSQVISLIVSEPDKTLRIERG